MHNFYTTASERLIQLIEYNFLLYSTGEDTQREKWTVMLKTPPVLKLLIGPLLLAEMVNLLLKLNLFCSLGPQKAPALIMNFCSGMESSLNQTFLYTF